MQETEAQKRERRHREDLERLRGFRPIDDTFMRGLFKDNIPLAELVLRIIVGKPDLTLVKCETQADLKTGDGRKVCLPGRIRYGQHRKEVRHRDTACRQRC